MATEDDGPGGIRPVQAGGETEGRSFSPEVRRWVPKLGERVPSFEAMTTRGSIRFEDWAEGNWVLLFSHPAAMTPVCTTEIAAFADNAEELNARNVRLFGISPSSCETSRAWQV